MPEAGNPQAWNRFAYALNNPISLLDPNGHDPCTGNPHTHMPDCGVSNNEGLLGLPPYEDDYLYAVADPAGDISAFVLLMSDPTYVANVYLESWQTSDIFRDLQSYAEYSELHSSAQDLILSAIDQGYGPEYAQALRDVILYGPRGEDMDLSAQRELLMAIGIGGGGLAGIGGLAAVGGATPVRNGQKGVARVGEITGADMTQYTMPDRGRRYDGRMRVGDKLFNLEVKTITNGTVYYPNGFTVKQVAYDAGQPGNVLYCFVGGCPSTKFVQMLKATGMPWVELQK